MTSSQENRPIALLLAIVFAAFNLGLPIVVASCPMMEMTPGVVCCAMNDIPADGVERITNFVDTSCCETKYASERNTTEFLQEQLKRIEASKLLVLALQRDCIQCAIQNPQCTIPPSSFPPRIIDIPILGSSLLI